MLNVKQITRNECEPFILGIHYAKRWPSITWAFGLFKNSNLVGVVTYGTPASASLRKGVCGELFSDDVLELNRLCLRDNTPNQASFLVGRSLKMLPERKIIISFADTDQGHIGYVYQATNFIYCGLSAKRTDWKLKGKEHLHGQTVADEFRGQPDRAKLMRNKYGDDFYLAPRSRKHRYIYFTGTPRDRKELRQVLRYQVEDYPKNEIPEWLR